MDWIGLVIFILALALKAWGESEKQKKARQARRQSRPPAGSPTTPPAPPPVAQPEPDLPPLSRSPLYELFEEFLELFEEGKEEREEKEAVQPVAVEAPWEPPAPPKQVVPQVRPPEPAALVGTAPASAKRPAVQPVLPGLELSRAAEGVIWAEILGPPRALRPFRR